MQFANPIERSMSFAKGIRSQIGGGDYGSYQEPGTFQSAVFNWSEATRHFVCTIWFPIFCFHDFVSHFKIGQHFLYVGRTNGGHFVWLVWPCLSFTSASANVRFRNIRKHFILFQQNCQLSVSVWGTNRGHFVWLAWSCLYLCFYYFGFTTLYRGRRNGVSFLYPPAPSGAPRTCFKP